MKLNGLDKDLGLRSKNLLNITAHYISTMS
jgi:hypothetical protein